MKKQSVLCALLVLILLVSLTACESEDTSNAPSTTITAAPTTTTTGTTITTTTTTKLTATTTVTTTTQTVSTTPTTRLPTTTVYIPPSPRPYFEGTVLEINGDDVLIRVDKVIEGPHLDGTVWANKNSLWKHHGGNVWVVGMPIKVDYTGEIIKGDPPRLKTVVMFCDCPYYLQTKGTKATATDLRTTDPNRAKTTKLQTTTQ